MGVPSISQLGVCFAVESSKPTAASQTDADADAGADAADSVDSNLTGAATLEPLPPMTDPENLQRPARLHAVAVSRCDVRDAHLATPFDLDAYMRLPVEQYTLSVLEAGTLTRYEGQPGRFRFQVPRLQFFNVWVEPVVDVYVRVPEADDETPEVLLRSEGCYMYGSPAFDKLRLNDKFHMEFETRVRARTSGRPTFADDEDGETWSANGEIEGGRGELLARSEINVACEVVAPFHLVPRRALEKTCSAVLNGLIKLLLPTFVAQLRDDFGIWATHPEARKARVEKAEREYGKT